MTEPTMIDAEIVRITAQMDQADAHQAQQDTWLARRYTTLTTAGMAPAAAAEIVAEYQAHLWCPTVTVIGMGEDDA